MQFDENEHNRDENGRFTYKNGSGKSEEERLIELVKKYSSNPDDVKKLEKSNVSGKGQLTKKEFAIWYQKIGEIKSGAYVRVFSGEKYIPISEFDKEDKLHYKIAVTGGTYVKPKLIKVLEFGTDDDLQLFLETIDWSE